MGTYDTIDNIVFTTNDIDISYIFCLYILQILTASGIDYIESIVANIESRMKSKAVDSEPDYSDNQLRQ